MNFRIGSRSVASTACCRRKSIRQDKKYLPTAPGLAREHGVHPITVSQGTLASRSQRGRSKRERQRDRGTEREKRVPESEGSVFNSTPYNSTYPFTASEDCL